MITKYIKLKSTTADGLAGILGRGQESCAGKLERLRRKIKFQKNKKFLPSVFFRQFHDNCERWRPDPEFLWPPIFNYGK